MTGSSGPAAMGAGRDLSHVRAWVFDLDNTLYPRSSGLFRQIEERMNRFVMELLGVDRGEANRIRVRYWSEYGTTLAGLMKERGVDPHAYLRNVHDISLEAIAPDPDLARGVSGLPGRKIVYTNGPEFHALRVLEALGLSGLFGAVYGVERADFIPKPKPEAFRLVFGIEGIEGPEAAMFEDEARNLAYPHRIGMVTVLVGDGRRESHVDHATNDLPGFLRQIAGGA